MYVTDSPHADRQRLEQLLAQRRTTSPLPVAQREAQAEALLEAAAAERKSLQAYATSLAKSREAGTDLFQEAVLACHDAIQRKGFVGTVYAGYISRAIRYLHWNRNRGRKEVLLGESMESVLADDATAPDHTEALAALTEQALAAHYKPNDQAAFLLHIDGYSFREIGELTGRDYSWIARKVDKMKGYLAALLRPQLQKLCEAEN